MHVSLENFSLPPREEALFLAWPSDGQAGGLLRFDEPEQWRAFIRNLAIHPIIPDIVTIKFERAQILYLLGWMDLGLIKAGELAADRFGIGAYGSVRRLDFEAEAQLRDTSRSHGRY